MQINETIDEFFEIDIGMALQFKYIQNAQTNIQHAAVSVNFILLNVRWQVAEETDRVIAPMTYDIVVWNADCRS